MRYGSEHAIRQMVDGEWGKARPCGTGPALKKGWNTSQQHLKTKMQLTHNAMMREIHGR